MNVRVIVLWATWLSLAWAAGLTGLAAAGNTWVLDRVAGGFYVESGMPMWLRVVYGLMTVGILSVAWLVLRYFQNDVTRRQRNLGRLVILLFTLSATVNALSQSEPERYNAIAAAVTVVGVALLRRRQVSDYIDLRSRR